MSDRVRRIYQGTVGQFVRRRVLSSVNDGRDANKRDDDDGRLCGSGVIAARSDLLGRRRGGCRCQLCADRFPVYRRAAQDEVQQVGSDQRF
ncbi:hypothetical protein D3C76_1470790 [compost metagenome]